MGRGALHPLQETAYIGGGDITTISRHQWPGRIWDWEAWDALLELLLRALRELQPPTAYIRVSALALKRFESHPQP